MTISVTTDIVHDGVRNLIMNFTGVSDGTGNETDVVKVARGKGIKIRKVSADVFGGLVTLKWKGNQPQTIAQLSGGTHDMDFTRMGGLINRTDGDGSITLTTSGFGAGSAYSITLEMITT